MNDLSIIDKVKPDKQNDISGNDLIITVSVCQSVTDTAIKSQSAKWCDVATKLVKHTEQTNKDGLGVIFASFKTPIRAKENIDQYYCICLDCDTTKDYEPPSPQEVKTRIEALGLTAAIYTTYNHLTPPDQNNDKPSGNRYRVVVPLTKPIDKEQLKTYSEYLGQLLNLQIDSASYTPSQLFYIASCRKDAPRYGCYIEGKALDVKTIPTKPTQKEHVKPQYSVTNSVLNDLSYSNIKQQAKNQWLGVLSSLGIHINADNKHHPCPACGGTDRFRFDDLDGHGTFICSQGTGETIAGDGFNLIQHCFNCSDKDALQYAINALGIDTSKSNFKLLNHKLRKSIEWLEPLPLFDEVKKANAYPVDLFPPIAQHAIKAIAHHVQAPIALAGQCVLGAMAYLAQSKVNAYSNNNPNGTPCSLFLLTEGESGIRKTTCQNLSNKVINEREKSLNIEYAECLKNYLDGANNPNAKMKKEFLSSNQPPINPKTVFTDTTLEPLTSAFIDGMTNAMLCTDEAAQFFGGHTMTGETATGALGTLTKLWDSGYIERIRSKSNLNSSGHAYDVRLTLNLLGQREVLYNELNDPIKRGQGFLPRFLFSAPDSLAGSRLLTIEGVNEKPYSDSRLQNFWKRCTDLLDDTPQIIVPDALGTDKRTVIPLDEDALHFWLAYYNETETLQSKDKDYEFLRAFAGRTGENVLRIATVLAYFEQSIKINTDIMRCAIGIADHSLKEWLRYADVSITNKNAVNAQVLERWLISYQLKNIDKDLTRRIVTQYAPNKLRCKNILQKALDELIDRQRVNLFADGIIKINPVLLRN